MTPRERYLERVLILRTMLGHGEMYAADIADRASSVCDHDALEGLAPISRRAIGQKLASMAGDGLVASSLDSFGGPRRWLVTTRGRTVAEQFVAEEVSA